MCDKEQEGQEVEKEKTGLTNIEVRIGAGITICLFICYFIPQIQKLAALWQAVSLRRTDTERK